MADREFCACTAYGSAESGCVVCWRCEQPIVTVDDDKDALTANLLGLCVAYRARLEKISDAVGRAEVQFVHPFGTGHALQFKGSDWFDVQAAKDTLDSPVSPVADGKTS